MNNGKETKLSFNGEEEMMDYVHQCQQLHFLKSKSEIEPVEQILVDPSDENHWDDLHVLILRNNRIVVEDGGFTISMCSNRALKLAAALISVVIKGVGSRRKSDAM